MSGPKVSGEAVSTLCTFKRGRRKDEPQRIKRESSAVLLELDTFPHVVNVIGFLAWRNAMAVPSV